MLKNYRAVFARPGTAMFCLAGLVMRLPMPMYGLGLVLIVSARTGQYTFAGVLSALYVFGGVPGNPVLARLADRYGQRQVVIPATGVHVASGAVLVVLFETDAPNWSLLLPTLVLGFSYISVPSLVRARWSHVLAGRQELTTAFSLESVLDEVVFIVGPLLATLIATTVDPVLLLVACGALVTVGATALCAQRSSEPPAHADPAVKHPIALTRRGMVVLCLAATAMGGIFAGAEVAIVAFCGEQGVRGATGAVLACFASGSCLSGFLYGARSWHSDVLGRYRLHSLVFGVLPLLFLAAENVPVLALCTFVVGLGIAPTIITSFGLVDRLVPASVLNEGMAWLTTGLNLGYGISVAIAGRITDAHGARTAFLVPVTAGVLMAVGALALYRRLAVEGSTGAVLSR